MTRSPDEDHALRNQIAIVVGYCELLLSEVAEDHPMRADLGELHKAACTALQMLTRDTDAS